MTPDPDFDLGDVAATASADTVKDFTDGVDPMVNNLNNPAVSGCVCVCVCMCVHMAYYHRLENFTVRKF